MDFIRILTEQKEERDSLPLESYCARNQLKEVDVFSPLAQVVMGMRRSGKTVLCHQALHAAGVNYAFINFDDNEQALYPVEPVVLDETGVYESMIRRSSRSLTKNLVLYDCRKISSNFFHFNLV